LSSKEWPPLELLVEALKFSFYESGRPLQSWLQSKGDSTQPVKIEPIVRSEAISIHMDDLEQTVRKDQLLSLYDDIRTSLDILRKKRLLLNSFRRQLADELLGARDRAGIEAKVPELEREIDEESEKLGNLLDEVLETPRRSGSHTDTQKQPGAKPGSDNSRHSSTSSNFVSAVLTPLLFLVVGVAALVAVPYVLRDWPLTITVYLVLLIVLVLFIPYAGLQYRSISRRDWFAAYLAALEKIPGLETLISRWRNPGA
jgi:hypothetical protein